MNLRHRLSTGLAALLKILTLKCKHCRRLDSDSLDRQLDLTDRLARLGHKLSCGGCRRSAVQIKRINDAASALSSQPSGQMPPERQMPPEIRERIAARLKERVQAAVPTPGQTKKNWPKPSNGSNP